MRRYSSQSPSIMGIPYVKAAALVCALGILCLFTSCSPRVGSTITKSYPALSTESPITVYYLQERFPVDADTLGKVKISDTGFTTKCDSLTVINEIKNEARKAGGNAVKITSHRKPSILGSSCHQMEAMILRIDESSIRSAFLAGTDSIAPMNDSLRMKPKSLLPKFKIAIHTGPGWRTAELADGMSRDEHSFYKDLMSGWVAGASLQYYFNDSYGIGLTYSAYNTKNSIYGERINTGERGTLSEKDNITFIGPSFLMRHFSKDQKWGLNMKLGLGYLRYSADQTFNNYFTELRGGTVGMNISIGAEYKFDKHWGITLDLAGTAGILDEIDINENGVKQTITMDDDKREGLGHVMLLGGISYSF